MKLLTTVDVPFLNIQLFSNWHDTACVSDTLPWRYSRLYLNIPKENPFKLTLNREREIRQKIRLALSWRTVDGEMIDYCTLKFYIVVLWRFLGAFCPNLAGIWKRLGRHEVNWKDLQFDSLICMTGGNLKTHQEDN